MSDLAESAVQAALVDRLTKRDLGWRFLGPSDLPRQLDGVMLEEHVSEALIRLNPVIAERPERSEEVLPRLRATLLAVANDGMVAANEEMTAWLCGRKTIKFLDTDEYVSVRLIDFDEPRSNRLVVSTEVTFAPGHEDRRYDLVLFVNGFPLVVGETKTPISKYTSWLNGANDVYNGYQVKTPAFFVPNVLLFATEGKELRYGAVRQPGETWLPWSRTTDDLLLPGMASVLRSAELLLSPEMVLDILRTYTLFSRRSSAQGGYVMKVIPRYPQVEAVEGIVERSAGHGETPRPGLAPPRLRQDVAYGLRRGEAASAARLRRTDDPRSARSPRPDRTGAG